MSLAPTIHSGHRPTRGRWHWRWGWPPLARLYPSCVVCDQLWPCYVERICQGRREGTSAY